MNSKVFSWDPSRQVQSMVTINVSESYRHTNSPKRYCQVISAILPEPWQQHRCYHQGRADCKVHWILLVLLLLRAVVECKGRKAWLRARSNGYTCGLLSLAELTIVNERTNGTRVLLSTSDSPNSSVASVRLRLYALVSVLSAVYLQRLYVVGNFYYILGTNCTLNTIVAFDCEHATGCKDRDH